MKHTPLRRSSRRSTTHLIRRASAVALAALAFAIATADTAAEAGDFLMEHGGVGRE